MESTVPQAQDLQHLEGAALAFACSLRAIDGREPVPALVQGVPHDCRRCVVAATANHGLSPRAAQWEVGGVAAKVSASGVKIKGSPEVRLPFAVCEFMAAFDAQEIPALIVDGAGVGDFAEGDSVSATTLDVLKMARKRLASGWVQGTSVRRNDDQSKSYCAVGGLTIAQIDCEASNDAYCAAEKALADVIGTTEIVAWNDAAARTQAEVLATFDRAIAAEESK